MKTSLETFKISKEMQAKIDTLRDSERTPAKSFTAEQDAIISQFYVKKNKDDLAKLIGVSVGTMRKRYLELTGGKTK
jgi:hypothetical protein